MPKARRSGAAALAEEPGATLQPAEPVKPSRSTLGPAATGIPGAGGIFKSAAVEVLRMERRLMTTGEITKIALQRGFLKAQGKTPEATMASALYTDVKKKSGTSLFTRPQEGLFGLREWIEEGFFPEGFWAGGGPQLEFADSGVPVAVNATYRRRNTVTQHRVTQRGPDGQIITTVSGIVPTAAPVAAPAAAAPAEDHEEAQPGVAGGAAAALTALAAPLVAAAAPRPASSGRAPGARATGAAPRSAGRAAAGKGRGGATATIIATAIANSDEDGSDHYHSAGDLTGGDVASQGVDAGAGGGDSSKAAAPSPADLLFLLGEAALADGSAPAPAGDAVAVAMLGGADAAKRIARDDAADTNAVLEPSEAGALPADAAGSSGGAAGPSDMDDAAAAAAAAAALVEARSSPGPSRGSAPLSGGDPLLALHEAAAGGPPHVGIDIKPQKARKRSHLAVSVGGSGGGSVDEDRIAAALLGGMAGAPSCDAYYRDGSAGLSHAPARARQQQHHAAAPAGVDPWHMMQQMQWQQQQYMMMAAANKGIGYFDPASMMAGGWDPSAAAASAGGAGDLLHHMSVSLGLPPPGPLPAGARRGSPAPGAAKAGSAKRRRGASGSPPAPPTPKNPGDLEKLDDWQATIESAEKALGRDHPAVGRAWLDLARALQAAGVRGDRAALAARRAHDVLVAAAAGQGGAAGEGFAYLLEKLARTAEEQEQSAAAAAASAEAQRQQAAVAQQQAVAAAVEALQSALPGEHQHYHQQQQQLQAVANPDTPDAAMGEAALAAAAAAAPMETC